VSERRGFWSRRPRKGREDAALLGAARVHDLRHTPYAELRDAARRPPDVEQVRGPSGEAFERRTSIRRFTRGGQEELRIAVRVTSGRSWRSRLDPLAEEVVLATPDGEMTGEHTLASAGSDPRRFGPRRTDG
jgi:hypothetical protein